MCEYERMEKAILEEQPYNWKKHWLFNLPEFLYFILKVIFLLTFAQIAIASVLQATVEILPEFCLKYHE